MIIFEGVFQMKELLGLFSLSNKGDVPIGLKRYKSELKLNQPDIQERKEFSFTNFVQYSTNSSFRLPEQVEEIEEEKSFSWLSYIFGDDEEEEDEYVEEFF